MEINDCSAIVTGGGSGLGEATVRKLTAMGARCTIFDIKEEPAKKLAEELGKGTNYVVGDVSNPDDCQRAVDQAAEGGKLRIAVNCAGIGWIGRVINRDNSPHDLKSFQFIQNVNLIGTFNVMTRASSAIAQTETQEDGSSGVVVNTASVAAFEGQIGQLAYSASKGAIVGMTVPASRDLAVSGIRVCAIAPGLFDTPLLGLLPEPQKEALGQSVLFPKRLGKPSEYADLVAFIVSCDYLNGEVIRLDGGIRMPPK